jgi:uncharacterized protein (TIGR02147 family)
MSLMETTNFRKYLQSEFAKRSGKNPRYSLRLFARQLKVHPGTLSQILSGKRALTVAIVKSLSETLGLDPKMMATFMAGVNQHAGVGVNAGPSEIASTEIAYDTFSVISDYYHYAILELTRTQGFRGDIDWIARRLGVSKVECAAAVERLVRLGLLKIEDDGTWIDVQLSLTHDLDPNYSNAALRKHQEQILKLSAEALEEIPRTERDHLSNIVAYDPKDLPEIKERIRKFRKELMAFVQRSGTKAQEVSALNVAFFPLTAELAPVSANKKQESQDRNEESKLGLGP